MPRVGHRVRQLKKDIRMGQTGISTGLEGLKGCGLDSCILKQCTEPSVVQTKMMVGSES